MQKNMLKYWFVVLCLARGSNAYAMADWLRSKLADHASNTVLNLDAHRARQAAVRAAFQKCEESHLNQETPDSECRDFLMAAHKAAVDGYNAIREDKKCNEKPLAIIEKIVAALKTAQHFYAGVAGAFAQNEKIAESTAVAILNFPSKQAATWMTIGKYALTDKRMGKYAARVLCSRSGTVPTSMKIYSVADVLQPVAASVIVDAIADHLPDMKGTWPQNYPYLAELMQDYIIPWSAETLAYNATMAGINCATDRNQKAYFNFWFGGR